MTAVPAPSEHSQAAGKDHPCNSSYAAERKGMKKPPRYAHGKVLPVYFGAM
jgi:hypothetical protein